MSPSGDEVRALSDRSLLEAGVVAHAKRSLYHRGQALVQSFLDANPIGGRLGFVEERIYDKFATCAYYRNDVIYIDVPACAAIGTAGRQWSYPGYVVDRTPYGVVCHELGHHVDRAHGSVPGSLSPSLRALTEEDPITTYCPNTNEWFAEIFRLFVTNPDLLRLIRPKTYAILLDLYRVVERRPWEAVIESERQRAAARNKIAEAERKARRRA